MKNLVLHTLFAIARLHYAFSSTIRSAIGSSIFKKLFSPENGENVYTYNRAGITVRYSFGYVAESADNSDSPTLYVRLVDIEFSEPVPLRELPFLVPEFKPPIEPDAPAFRSNLMLLLFKGPSNPTARLLIREREKEQLNDWTLAFQLFSLQGLPDYLTLNVPIDRMEISAQSIIFVKTRQRLTHETIQNPFAPEFADRPPPPAPSKKIPVPQYSE